MFPHDCVLTGKLSSVMGFTLLHVRLITWVLVHAWTLLMAAGLIDKARDMLAGEMAALVGESYERAYGDMIRVQQLQELEEAIAYSRAPELARLTHDTGEHHHLGNAGKCDLWILSLRPPQR